MPSQKVPPTLNSQLGMGKQPYSSHNSNQGVKELSHHLYAPTWVTSSSYLARRTHIFFGHFIKFLFFHILYHVEILHYITYMVTCAYHFIKMCFQYINIIHALYFLFQFLKYNMSSNRKTICCNKTVFYSISYPMGNKIPRVLV